MRFTVATLRPSGEKATALTSCPESVARGNASFPRLISVCPVSAPQTVAPQSPPAANRRPLEEKTAQLLGRKWGSFSGWVHATGNATEITGPVCPPRTCGCRPVPASQIVASPSLPKLRLPVTIRVPSADTAIWDYRMAASAVTPTADLGGRRFEAGPRCYAFSQRSNHAIPTGNTSGGTP